MISLINRDEFKIKPSKKIWHYLCYCGVKDRKVVSSGRINGVASQRRESYLGY